MKFSRKENKLLTPKESKLLYKIKKELVSSHEKCNGSGYCSKDGEIYKCDCMKILSYLIDLVKSNIPLDYWNLSLESLSVAPQYLQTVKKYISKLDNAVEKGIGLFFICNTRGVGKTSLACEIGKAAITKRYSVYYNLMQTVISDKFTDTQEIIKKIKDAELIIIDEIDKVAMKKESTLAVQIENFLRELLPAGKTIILCSNMNIEEIEEKIEIGSLIQRYLKIIEMEGEDYSKKKNKNLDSLLDNKIDYFSETMLKNANEHDKNEDVAYEKQEFEWEG
jgi:DNA replication protein DnaC